MENQKLLDLETDLTKNDPKTNFSDTEDAVLTESLQHKYENAIDDDLILVPEKMTNEEKPLENTFEVIDQESKTIHDVQEEAEDTNISDEEKDNLFEDDPVSYTKIEDLPTAPKIESPKTEESVFSEKPVPADKPESVIADTTKTAIIQEKEPVNTVQPEVKVADTPVAISKVTTKKDTDEGDVCDIKIGPDELFCRIGLGKNFKIIILIIQYLIKCHNLIFCKIYF